MLERRLIDDRGGVEGIRQHRLPVARIDELDPEQKPAPADLLDDLEARQRSAPLLSVGGR